MEVEIVTQQSPPALARDINKQPEQCSSCSSKRSAAMHKKNSLTHRLITPPPPLLLPHPHSSPIHYPSSTLPPKHHFHQRRNNIISDISTPPPPHAMHSIAIMDSMPSVVINGLDTTESSLDLTDSQGHKNSSSKSSTRKSVISLSDLKPLRPGYMTDGLRLIDFVLAYEHRNDEEAAEEDEEDSKSSCDEEEDVDERTGKHLRGWRNKAVKRNAFENNLRELGLQLEHVKAQRSNVRFVLIHAPFRVLTNQAEVMKIKMPVACQNCSFCRFQYPSSFYKPHSFFYSCIQGFVRRINIMEVDESIRDRIDPPLHYTLPFVEQHLTCFLNHEDSEHFFTRADRSRMVHDLLIRTRYDRKQQAGKFRFGIGRLLANGSYTAAYPLHERIHHGAGPLPPLEERSDRQLLYELWVHPSNVWRLQPIHLIRNYFGTRLGLYFAWLGSYTRALVALAVMAVLTVAYGVATVGDDVVSNEICKAHATLICPQCNSHHCDFTRLSSNCFLARLSYIFNNNVTVAYTMLVCVWSAVWFQMWSRLRAELAYKWNVFRCENSSEDDVMLPEFQQRKRGSVRINPVTHMEEPVVPTPEKIFRNLGTWLTVLLVLCFVAIFAIGLLAYRVIARNVFQEVVDNDFLNSKALIITSTTAAFINLAFIMVMNQLYGRLACKLTHLECPKTQTEFDNSYKLKVFFFRFINFYSSLFYIAFIKGRFQGPRGAYDDENGNKIRVYTQDDCGPLGCGVELAIQLCVIMVGQLVFGEFMEIGYPVMMHRFRLWRLHLLPTSKPRNASTASSKVISFGSSDGSVQDVEEVVCNRVAQVECDYSLHRLSHQYLSDEYLEMVMQFGFVTMFVAAMPLAPLFAFINNVFEIRLDAYKYLLTKRRPVAAQADTNGVWMQILDVLSRVGILTNACIIAFTYDFIPQLVYLYRHSTITGYADDSFSYSQSSHYGISPIFGNVTQCRFRGYRRPPCSLHLGGGGECSDDQELQHRWWAMLAMRLLFVVVFQNLVQAIRALITYAIPSVPAHVTEQILRERYLARQAVLQRPVLQHAGSEDSLVSRRCSVLVNTRKASMVAARNGIPYLNNQVHPPATPTDGECKLKWLNAYSSRPTV